MLDPQSTDILHQLIVDEDYRAFESRFTRDGKGRRPDITPPPLTNKVLVQLMDIMQNGGYEQKKVLDWFQYLFPDNPLNGTDRLRHMIVAVHRKARQLVEDPQELSTYLYLSFNVSLVSDALLEIGLDKTLLLAENWSDRLENVRLTNEIVLELDKFQNTQKLNTSFAAKWVFLLLNGSGQIDIDKKSLKNINTKIVRLKTQKHKIVGKKSNPEVLESFLKERFNLEKSQTVEQTENKSDRDEVKTNYCSNCAQLKEALKGTSDLLTLEREKVSALNRQMKELESTKTENKKLIKNLKQKIWRSQSKIANTKCHLQTSERKRKLNDSEKNKKINQLEANLVTKQRKIKLLERDNRELNLNNSILNERIFKQQTLQEIGIKSGENNAYADNVRQTVMLLQSEAGVSSKNVSNVIKIVGKHIFNHDFKENLPSNQTCLNMNAEGLVLSNIQVAEKMLSSENVTLHLDGTSRDHQKVVNHQISLDDGSSLHLGFTLVATEDSNTILDITIALLKKLSECQSEVSYDTANEIFLNLLKKLKSTMTDRASTMKCFDKKLEEFLKSELGEETEINFLHCNAHFLLGLSSASDNVFKKLEEEIKAETKAPIGRDKHIQFSRFQSDSETCTTRLIRTLCDILGPRGDQKNGCRIEWKAFCPDTKVPSFKSNRFNCFFEAAAAIIHHYDKIKSFFVSGVLPESSNQKIQSVGLDVRDLNLVGCICALALFFLKVSGPYWNLVNSSATYSQFCQHVRVMYHKFSEWSSDALELLSHEFSSLFGEAFSLVKSPYYDSVHNFIKSDSCNLSIVKRSLVAISESCATVTARQLGNFLDGTFNPDDENIAEILKNCPLTNLIGESSFGDLDYDIRKKANCSNLQRTASHCIKRNKTCSTFLDSKSKTEKALLFSAARKKRKALVEEAKNQQTEVSVKVQERMIQNQQKKIDKEATAIEKHGKLLKRLEENGGICRDSEDIDSLLESVSAVKSKKQITEIFKDQIRYHKLVSNAKELNLSGTLEDIILRLKTFLN